MKDEPWVIRNLDLAEGPQGAPACARPQLLVFWWRGLPLGSRALLAEETPFRPDQIVSAAADMIAEQIDTRRGFDELPRAGVDGEPLVRSNIARAAGQAGILQRLDALASQSSPDARQLTVIICTRDRPQMLQACLQSLKAQASPPGQIVVVDNSTDGAARSTCDAHAGVTYVQEPRPGLSRARNTGVKVARGELVAFTDDDVQLTANWTQEIVRAFAEGVVDAVTGLVLPARLDTAAQRVFQLELGGFTSRYAPLVFDPSFLDRTRAMGPQVWRIGAGANMAFRRSVFARFGVFDERLGAGGAGCSEDSEFWYRILAGGGSCLYEPRAVVLHHHRADWPSLRRQLRAYMQGHVAALVAQADRYGDGGNIRRIFRQLPAYFVRTAIQSVQNTAWWRLPLLWQEIMGWAAGLTYLVRPGWRKAGRRRSKPPPEAMPATGTVRRA